MLRNRPGIELLPNAFQGGVSVVSFAKPHVDSHWHFHPEVELVWLEQGEGVLHIGNVISAYRPGQLILTGANLPHAYGSYPQQRRGARWMVLHCRTNLWGDAFWQLPEMKPVAELFVQAGRGIIFEGEAVANCVGLLRRIQRLPQDAGRMSAVLELFDTLAKLQTYRYLNTEIVALEEATDARMISLLAWLDDRVSDADLTQQEAAEKIRMSAQAFSRFFRQYTAKTFSSYLNEIRVARACRYLVGSSRAVSEIAYKVGFNNLSNFNRQFRSVTGSTPRAYRESRGGSGL